VREHTAILLSPGAPHAGNLVRDYANMYKGRGGGKAKLARAIFERAEDLEMFLDLIEKHLRA
jgi:alanyl-tRNA synthetase